MPLAKSRLGLQPACLTLRNFGGTKLRITVESKRAKTATAVGIKNDGQRREKRRATLEKTMGNGVKNDGQQNLKRRATKFRATGNEILNNGQRNIVK